MSQKRAYSTAALAVAIGLSLAGPSVVAAAQDQQTATPTALSVREAVQYALTHSPQLGAARRERRAADEEVTVARKERVPRLDAVFSGRYESIRRAVIEMGPVNLWPQDRIFGSGILTLDAVFSVPLYTGGRIPANVRRAELEREIADDFVARVEDNLAFAVARTYLTILAQDKIIEATQESIEALTESQRRVSQFREVGKVPSLDLYRVNSQLADVTAELATEEARRRTLLAELRALMALPGAADVTLTDELTFAPAEAELDEALRQAFESNPAYAAARRRVAQQRQVVRMARAELKPQVDLGGYGGAASSQHGAPIDRWGLRVTASQFLFDGGRVRAEVRAEEETLGREEELLRQTGLDLAAEVETSLNEAEDAAARIEALRTVLEEAREALRLEQLKYENDKGLVNDILLAQAKLLEVEVAYFRALRDYGVAQARLDRAVGRTGTR